MKHARPDYNRIQDPEHKIPENEPVFLLRGQDKVAPVVVEFWAKMAEDAGAKDDIINAARLQAEAMRRWHHDVSAKVPDLPAKKEISEVDLIEITSLADKLDATGHVGYGIQMSEMFVDIAKETGLSVPEVKNQARAYRAAHRK